MTRRLAWTLALMASFAAAEAAAAERLFFQNHRVTDAQHYEIKGALVHVTLASGAVVVFAGVSRNHHAGRSVVTLFYEAHEPLALAEMERLRAESAQRFGARHVFVHHRLGEVPVGESSVIIAVSSDHRASAFDAARWLMDQIKENVPIFKREEGEDGQVWVGMGP